MADSPLSSDLELDSSPQRVAATSDDIPIVSGANTKSKSKPHSKSKTKKSVDKPAKVDKWAQRRHEVLERQYDKARRTAEAHSENNAPIAGGASAPEHQTVQSVLPVVSQQVQAQATAAAPDYTGTVFGCQGNMDYLPLHQSAGLAPSTRRLPEATFTPTAAGLRGAASQPAQAQVLDLQAMVSNALANIFQAGIQQASQANPPVTPLQLRPPAAPLPMAPQHLQGDEYLEDDYLDDTLGR